jgi:hypothetical protein
MKCAFPKHEYFDGCFNPVALSHAIGNSEIELEMSAANIQKLSRINNIEHPPRYWNPGCNPLGIAVRLINREKPLTAERRPT